MNATTVAPARFIGRCKRKGCTYRKAVDVPRMRVEEIDRRFGHRYSRLVYQRPDGGRTERPFDSWLWKVCCPDHEGATRWEVVRGEVTDHACDGRCMNAIGPSCECSCGGANHGGRYL